VSKVFRAIRNRRSHSKVTTDAPTHEELLPLVAAAARAADHGALRPWRLIELRGDARVRLGEAMAKASGLRGKAAAGFAAKSLRSSLVLAVVASRRKSSKVEIWEQDATAAGVAHLLTLLLADAGWGVMWRTGPLTRTSPVRRMHHLADTEELLGWLYIGGIPPGSKAGVRVKIDPSKHLSAL